MAEHRGQQATGVDAETDIPPTTLSSNHPAHEGIASEDAVGLKAVVAAHRPHVRAAGNDPIDEHPLSDRHGGHVSHAWCSATRRDATRRDGDGIRSPAPR
jgi:hypothetical protein